MLLKSSIVFATLFLIFGLIYLGVSKKKKRKKLIRITASITILSLIGSVVSFSLFIKAEDIKIFGRVKTYDIKEQYASTVNSDGTDIAYEYLPLAAFSNKDGLYFTNSKNDLFSISNSEANTVDNGIKKIDYSDTLCAKLTSSGTLKLDGEFMYSRYENEKITFNNKTIAHNVIDFSLTSNSVMYITENGKLYAFGFNEYGQLGDGSTKNRNSPEFILSDIKRAEISDTHTMVVDKFGTLYAIGDNSYSQLGTKNAVSATDFIKIMQGVKDIKVGNYLSLVLSVNGELYTAGINDLGQLGNGGESYRAEMILALTGVEKISLKNNTCAALTYSGELYVWGDNKNNKAGVETSEFINVPTKIAENIYDFALSDEAILLIDSQRNVSINRAGKTESVLTFDATIPDAYKQRFPTAEISGKQSV